MPYVSRKTYTRSIGLSCCFRQWRAESHCNKLHGYALEVKIDFEGSLDDKNWVVDFGGLKPLRHMIESSFDHKLLVAFDDPYKENILMLSSVFGVADCQVVEATGCEAFAKLIFQMAKQWLYIDGHSDRVKVAAVEVAEHEGNAAIYWED